MPCEPTGWRPRRGKYLSREGHTTEGFPAQSSSRTDRAVLVGPDLETSLRCYRGQVASSLFGEPTLRLRPGGRTPMARTIGMSSTCALGATGPVAWELQTSPIFWYEESCAVALSDNWFRSLALPLVVVGA